MKDIKALIIFFFSSFSVFGQNLPDTTKLPFAIADEKKIPDEDLINKKEGYYVTGVPDISSDPVNGFGVGIEGSLFFNGKRSDPFFQYTPYRSKLDIALFYTTKQQRELKVAYDVPYIFNTKWRLRMEAAYEVNPNLLYFGKDETSLNELQHGGKSYNNFDAYDAALSNRRPGASAGEAAVVTDKFYNTYQKEEAIFNMSAEHSYLDSKLRLLSGYEIAWVNISTFENKLSDANDLGGSSVSTPNGLSKLKDDNNQNKISGYGANLISMFQLGIVYDTRDLETDPSKGVFGEVTNEYSNAAIGSTFNFNKTFIHGKFYTQLFPSIFKRLIFASRLGVGYTAGDAPFYEYQDEWSSEGSIEGLGGGAHDKGLQTSPFPWTCNGFRQYRIALALRTNGSVQTTFSL